MPNIAVLIKSEIVRLSKKEVRSAVQPLRKSAAAHRREIAALKRTVATLERRIRQMARKVPVGNAAQPEDGTPIRFVAKGLVSLRKRLGLSAPQLARLLGVSTQSIYNWEHRKAVPRREQVAAIAALRPLGKREAHQRIDALKGPAKTGPAKRARARR